MPKSGLHLFIASRNSSIEQRKLTHWAQVFNAIAAKRREAIVKIVEVQLLRTIFEPRRNDIVGFLSFPVTRVAIEIGVSGILLGLH